MEINQERNNTTTSGLNEELFNIFNNVVIWTRIVFSIISLVLDTTAILLLKKRPSKRPDQALILAYVWTNGLFSVGNIAGGTYRQLIALEKTITTTTPIECVFKIGFAYVTIASKTSYLLLFLLSLERLLYFSRINWHSWLFSRVKTAIGLSALLGLCDYVISVCLAIFRRSRRIPIRCHGTDVYGDSYGTYNSYWVITLLLSSLFNYMLASLLFCKQVSNRSVPEGLTKIRRRREKAILNSVAAIVVITCTMKLIPKIMYLYAPSEFNVARRVGYMLEAAFLPISIALYFTIHPHLSIPLNSNCFKCDKVFKRKGKISNVYVG